MSTGMRDALLVSAAAAVHGPQLISSPEIFCPLLSNRD